MAKEKSPIIREYHESDLDKIFTLFKKYFGIWSADRWAKRWNWMYHEKRGCSYSKSIMLVIEYNGKIVGHFGAFPLPLQVRGKKYETLCGEGLIVDRKFSWHTFRIIRSVISKSEIFIGTSMNDAASALFNRCGAEKLPLSSIRYVYHLRYHGETLRELKNLLPPNFKWVANNFSSALITPIINFRRKRLSLKTPEISYNEKFHTLEKFSDSYDELWNTVSNEFNISFDKSSQYMNWRYIECPIVKPIILSCTDSDNKLIGLIIGCLRAHRDAQKIPCGNDGEILELIVSDNNPTYAKLLICKLISIFDNLKVDAVAATGLTLTYHSLLEEIGFVKTDVTWGTLRLISNLDDLSTNSLMSDNDWYYSGGDGDQLYDQGI